jgi:fibronectin-binding autotransporter adhesin
MIGSRAPVGAGTTTYSGTVVIGGPQRSRLILYSLNNAPVAFTHTISAASAPLAVVQIGGTAGTGLEYVNSNVTLSGSNTYAGGTQLYCGTLNIGNSTVLAGQTITTGPVGTGTFFIGTSGFPGATEPTINAVGAARTLANPIVVSNNFSIGAGSALTLSGAMDLGGAARIIAVNNISTFSGNITGAAGSALVKDGTGTLQLVGSATFSGPTAVSAGTLSVQTTQRLNGGLYIGPAAVVMKPGGATFLTTQAISIDNANGGFLDMADDDAVIDYTGTTPIAAIGKLISVGWAGGAWTGLGITSTSAAAVASSGAIIHKTALGYADASFLGIGTFTTGAVDSTSVLIRYTLSGDSNLDGTVNTLDFNLLAASFNNSGKLWQNGDYNFDGFVNGLDFNAIATNFGFNQPAPLPGEMPAVLVPEPGSVALLGFALLKQRRKNRRRSK